jgi:hypothetical protein
MNSSNIDLIDYLINSLSYVSYSNSSVTKTLTLSTNGNGSNCLGTIVVNNTTYSKQENQCYSCGIVTDTDLINTLNFLSNYAITIGVINIIIDGDNYQCNSYLTISGKPYYILIST